MMPVAVRYRFSARTGSRVGREDLDEITPAIIKRRVIQTRDITSPAAPKIGVHMPQHAYRELARTARVAVGGKPIVKTIDDRTK
jgi:hypothetical protein